VENQDWRQKRVNHNTNNLSFFEEITFRQPALLVSNRRVCISSINITPLPSQPQAAVISHYVPGWGGERVPIATRAVKDNIRMREAKKHLKRKKWQWRMSNKFENTEKVLRVNDPEKKYWLTIIYFPKYTLCRKHNIFLLNRPSIHLTENRKKKVVQVWISLFNQRIVFFDEVHSVLNVIWYF